MTIVVGTRM
jgi:hypothetical protein